MIYQFIANYLNYFNVMNFIDYKDCISIIVKNMNVKKKLKIKTNNRIKYKLNKNKL
jgi:hypothetical protein